MKIRGIEVNLSFVFSHLPEDNKKKKLRTKCVHMLQTARSLGAGEIRYKTVLATGRNVQPRRGVIGQKRAGLTI